MWACTTPVETSKPTETPISEQTVAELENGITNKHPSTYIILAQKLFVQGDKQNAVQWFYVGQIRYRAYLMANPDLDPSSDPALFSSLMSVVGTPLNEYIGGDGRCSLYVLLTIFIPPDSQDFALLGSWV